MITEKELINKYLGIPYKHKGRNLTALDCWGLAKLIYADLGFKLWDIEDYDEKWSQLGNNYFIENYYREWVKVKSPELFDGILFKNVDGIAFHCGIFLSDNRFIHCRRIGVVIDRLDNSQWQRRFEGFYHLKARDDNH